jgi:hypothetical protein
VPPPGAPPVASASGTAPDADRLASLIREELAAALRR